MRVTRLRVRRQVLYHGADKFFPALLSRRVTPLPFLSCLLLSVTKNKRKIVEKCTADSAAICLLACSGLLFFAAFVLPVA